MKKMFALLALALPLAAMSATIPLSAEGCTGDRFCYNVADGISLLYANSNYGGIVEVFLADGNYYMGKGPVGLSVASYPVYLQPSTTIPVNGHPSVMWVSADWITWITKGSGSGRGGYASHTHWALTDGTLVTP